VLIKINLKGIIVLSVVFSAVVLLGLTLYDKNSETEPKYVELTQKYSESLSEHANTKAKLASATAELAEKRISFKRLISTLKIVWDKTEPINNTNVLKEFGFENLDKLYFRKFYVKGRPGDPPATYATDISAGYMDADDIPDILISRIVVWPIPNTAILLLSSEKWRDLDEDVRDIPIPGEVAYRIQTQDAFGAMFSGDIDGDGRDDATIGMNSVSLLSSQVDLRDIKDAFDVDASSVGRFRPVKIIDDLDGDGTPEILWQQGDGPVKLFSGQKVLSMKPDGLTYDFSAEPIAEFPNDQNMWINYIYYRLPDLDKDSFPEIGRVSFARAEDRHQLLQIFLSTQGYRGERPIQIKIPRESGYGEPIRIASFGNYTDDDITDFWIQVPQKDFKTYLVDGYKLRAQIRLNKTKISFDDITSLVINSRLSEPHDVSIDHESGLMGYATKAADYDGDGLVDYVFTNGASFTYRGALFVIGGSTMRDWIKNKTSRPHSVNSDCVLKLTSYSQPFSYLAPMEIPAHLDFNSDGIPDLAIGADNDSQGGYATGAVYLVDGKAIGERISEKSRICEGGTH
jgi:hypothetical protein